MLLDSVSHGETKIGRWGYDANIDALPYVDELPQHWKDEVDKEIGLEVLPSSCSCVSPRKGSVSICEMFSQPAERPKSTRSCCVRLNKFLEPVKIFVRSNG
jgi:hypothetical protein